MAKERLIIFVKAPRAGCVKTRLAQKVGADRACAIYEEIVATALSNLRSLHALELRFTPDDAREEIVAWMQGDWTAEPQGDGDLGERLERAFVSAFANGAERVVVIGSDAPDVKTADVRAAWKQLKLYDLVIGPSVDGGYWLIGLRSLQPELFREIRWSSDQVLAQTLARAKSFGLRVQLLRILQDIDTETDWNAYVQERRRR